MLFSKNELHEVHMQTCLLVEVCHVVFDRAGQNDWAAWIATLMSPLPPLYCSNILSSARQHLIISGFQVATWICPAGNVGMCWINNLYVCVTGV